jgi:hypothetical protein
MLGKLKIVGLVLLGFLFVVGVVFTNSARAGLKLSLDELKQQIEQTYLVNVLGFRAITADGKVAYAVTVMTRGGDFGDAFQVNTFIVDADTGASISVFRHLDSGYVLPDGGDRDTNRQPPDAAQAGSTWR